MAVDIMICVPEFAEIEESKPVTVLCCRLFTQASLIVTGLVPVLLTVKVIVVLVKVMLVILTSSVDMNPTVSAPIHAATAMLTATVTAISMIDATTGLSAFAFFLIFLNVFISLSIPPLGLMSMLERQCHLNLTT
jgi:hypothetical protein